MTSSAIAADLQRARADFLDLPASGTRWSNEELLFHMVFGYMAVQRLRVLVRMFGRLPDSVGRGFAGVLNAGTPIFDVINYYGTRLAATDYNRNRMGVKFEKVIIGLQRSLAREKSHVLRRGMYFPTRWDPYFHDYMSLADVYRYPPFALRPSPSAT